MATLGLNDLKQFLLPTGVDAGYLAQFSLIDGTNYESLINDIISGLSMVTDTMIADPQYGSLVSTTEELFLEYRQGQTTTGLQTRTEYGINDARRGQTIGHTLPIQTYDRRMAWTMDFLRKARRAQLDADIAEAVYDTKDTFQRAVLTRFFTTTENLIATAGYDVPFIKGAGTVQLVPPAYNGRTFAATHTHFDRQTTSSQATALTNGAAHLWEHGIKGPYVGIVPLADVATYTALAKFIRPQRAVDYQRTDSAVNYAVAPMNEDVYFGMYETDYGLVYLWSTPRLPTAYLGMYKSYGNNAQMNPLAMRYDPQLGPNPVLMRGESVRMFPIENAIIQHEFGIGVRNRLNGYACYFAASGNYTDPTIA